MHRQYISYSDDNGETWTKAMKVTRLISPESPAARAIEPNTGWIMVVWNRNSNLGSHGKNRTPLTVGFSHDDGKSWFGFHNLEDEPGKAWSYPSIRFIDGAAHVLYYEQTKTELGGKPDRAQDEKFFVLRAHLEFGLPHRAIAASPSSRATPCQEAAHSLAGIELIRTSELPSGCRRASRRNTSFHREVLASLVGNFSSSE